MSLEILVVTFWYRLNTRRLPGWLIQFTCQYTKSKKIRNGAVYC